MKNQVLKQYVLGFAFSRTRDVIALIEKQKPDWQKGKFNGIGGKIEPEDSSPRDAMIREFKEETGVQTFYGGELGWNHFATMTFDDDIMGGKAVVYCFRMFSSQVYQCKTIESEQIKLFDLTGLAGLPLIDNLPVLIPMALHQGIKFCEINY